MSSSVYLFTKDFSEKVKAFESLENFTPKIKLLAQIIRSELLNFRSGNAHTKTRAEVRGGGKKPWKQKGTGRARHGSTRSPIWVGGGLVSAPRNTRNWHRNINKTSRLSGLKSLFADRLQSDCIFVFDSSFSYLKTKDAVVDLDNWTNKFEAKSKNILVIYSTEDKANLTGFLSTEVGMINVVNLKLSTLARYKYYLLTPKSQELLQTRLAN